MFFRDEINKKNHVFFLLKMMKTWCKKDGWTCLKYTKHETDLTHAVRLNPPSSSSADAFTFSTILWVCQNPYILRGWGGCGVVGAVEKNIEN